MIYMTCPPLDDMVELVREDVAEYGEPTLTDEEERSILALFDDLPTIIVEH